MEKTWTKEEFNKISADIDWVGVQDNPYGEDLIMFNDVTTGNTLALPLSKITLEGIKKHMDKHRGKWKDGLKGVQ